jgi:outer membrane protein insertion porin family
MIRSLQLLVLLFVFSVLLAVTTHAQSAESRVCIEFQGLNAFSSADISKAFGEQGLQILKQTSPSQSSINEAAKVLKTILAGRGYMDASVVGMRIEGSNVVRFVVDEGMRYPITSLSFVGNKRFTSDELASRLRESLANFSDKTKNGYDREILEYSIHQLANHMRSEGYLQARLSEPQIRVVGAGLAITIPITEGPLCRLGNLKLDGVQAVSLEEVRSLLPMTKGDVANGERIGKWLFEDVKRLYGEKGFIEYTAEPVPLFKNNPRNPEEGIVDFEVQIEEGKQFLLRSLTIEGEFISTKQVGEFFVLNVGDVFNQRLLEESVARINKAGLFEPIDVDRDFNYKTDRENATVALMLKLKKKSVADNH